MDTDKHFREIGTAASELRDDQLDGVTGGLVVVSIIGILVGMLIPDIRPVRTEAGK